MLTPGEPVSEARASVRRATPDQWSQCRQVRLAALAEAPEAFMSTLERERDFDEGVWRQRLNRGATFLAWLDDEPLGTATGIVDDPDDEFGVPGAWQLVGMWVDPRARGRGVGADLVEAVVAHARAEGATSLVLWVVEGNDRARALYEQTGFLSTGARQLVHEDEPDRWEVQLIRDLR